MIFKSINRLFPSYLGLIALLCLLSMPGCSASPDKARTSLNEIETRVAGKYVNEKDSRVYFELKNDGTFLFESGEVVPITGKYVLDGKHITVITSGEKTGLKMTFEETSIITSQGVRYTKQ